MGRGVVAMLLDFLGYALLYAYLEQVVQQEVGVGRPWHFPLSPAFWREVLGSEGTAAVAQPDDCHAGSAAAGSSEARPAGRGPASGQGPAQSAGAGGERPERPPELFEPEDGEGLRRLRAADRVVSVEGLRKVYANGAGAEVRAVDGLSLTMYEGECFCLLGHNGAGKSTTMAVLTGMTPATAGEVKVLGLRMPEDKLAIRRNMGFCMQQNVLWDTLTVEEHVALFAALLGLEPGVAKKSCDEVLRQVELAHKSHAQAATFLCRGSF